MKKTNPDLNKTKNTNPKSGPNSHARLTNLSRTYIDDYQADGNKGEYEQPLNIDHKKILHLWLAEVLPGPAFKLKYNLEKGVMIGTRQDCEQKLSEC